MEEGVEGATLFDCTTLGLNPFPRQANGFRITCRANKVPAFAVCAACQGYTSWLARPLRTWNLLQLSVDQTMLWNFMLLILRQSSQSFRMHPPRETDVHGLVIVGTPENALLQHLSAEVFQKRWRRDDLWRRPARPATQS